MNLRRRCRQIYSLLPLTTRPSLHEDCSFTGAGTRVRTGDLLITNQLLYLLSYTGSTMGYYSGVFGEVNKKTRSNILSDSIIQVGSRCQCIVYRLDKLGFRVAQRNARIKDVDVRSQL